MVEIICFTKILFRKSRKSHLDGNIKNSLIRVENFGLNAGPGWHPVVSDIINDQKLSEKILFNHISYSFNTSIAVLNVYWLKIKCFFERQKISEEASFSKTQT